MRSRGRQRAPCRRRTELVANAWDAGATKVSVFIPDEYGDLLVIEDNGNGLTAEEFQERWMTLGYNKLLRQGKQVLFPDNKKRSPRIAYRRRPTSVDRWPAPAMAAA